MKNQTSSLPPMRGLRIAVGVLSLFATSLSANAQLERVKVGIGRDSFGNDTDLRAKSTGLINPSKLYSYRISGNVVGFGGDLMARYPEPVSIGKFLNDLNPGSSTILAGSFSNPSGLLGKEMVLMNKSYSGSKKISGVTIGVKMDIVAKISATGQVSLSIINVKATKNRKPLTGTLTFSSGSKLVVDTAPVVAFLAKGQDAFTEPSGTEQGSVSIEVWRQGNLNKEAKVNWATADSTTGIAGQDYVASSGTLTFPPRVNKLSVTVPILHNASKTTNSKFTISLTPFPGVGTMIGENQVNTVSITNVD